MQQPDCPNCLVNRHVAPRINTQALYWCAICKTTFEGPERTHNRKRKAKGQRKFENYTLDELMATVHRMTHTPKGAT